MPPPRTVMVAGASPNAAEVHARLFDTFGFEAGWCEMADVVEKLRESEYGCAVVIGTTGSENSALKQVDAIRHTDHVNVRRTGVVLLASHMRNEIFAWEAGADAIVTIPAHIEDVVAAIDEVLGRSRLDRYNYRQAKLAEARGGP